MKAVLTAVLLAGCASTGAAVTPTWLPLPDGEVRRIAFGSCSNQYLAQPIWDALARAEPDLFLYSGDAIYADAAPPGTLGLPPGIDPIAKMRMDYAFLGAHPGFAKVRATVPVMATWDDHDYGRNDGGADFERKEASRDIFLDFFGMRPHATPGVYQARVFGPPGRRVQVIMLDTRYFRDAPVKGTQSKAEAKERKLVGRYVPNEDPKATMLGEQQWRWLEDQLRKPAEVRLLNSSVQVVAGEKGAESWGNFPHERRRLYDLIGTTRANGVIILSGDVHFAEISKTDDGPYPLHDFTSSPLAQYPTGSTGWEHCINSFRITDAYEKDSFGLVEIDWAARRITLRAVAADGSTAFEHRVLLDSLRPVK